MPDLPCVQAQLDDVSARSAAAHREYQAELEEMQQTMQSKQDQAASADAKWQEKAQQLELESQQLQVHLLLLAPRFLCALYSTSLIIARS